MDNIKKINPKILKLIIEQLDGVVITDTEGRYIYVNDVWSEMMGGIRLEEIQGRYVREIVPETMIHTVLETGKPINGHVIMAKGSIKKEAFSSYMPVIENGEVVAGFIHVIMRGMKDALHFTSKVNSMIHQLEYYQEELRKIRGAKYSLDNIVGNSPEIVHMKELIISAARSKSTVLIEGETGSGKELVAHSIHDLSIRKAAPFIKVNCAAIPRELLETEFFGYEEGAFTGASKGGKQGRFEMANGGSLFLDEINQMPYDLQPKLLRVLQEGEIEKIGGKGSIPINVRIIVASNVSLEKLIRTGKFRKDLFYRLNVIKIEIPPLRKRKEDIPLIADNLLEKLNFQLGMSVPRISEEAKNKLMEYDWPGNVRELQNVIERAMNLAWGEALHWKHFCDYFDGKNLVKTRCENNCKGYMIKTLKNDLEKDTIIKALENCRNNKTKAAEKLGISRTLLYRKLKKYNL